ncbi:zinc ABC transporter permease subunit ZnuB [Otariodibacter oris]|uniref:High-affinity zinc uptake system membrane protein ZnuB n=1 Tax=Otariodibacter oris TaxID=1032623 RepID=A0A420XHU0_9PAST|nr:zinc ABC transporter permease subunit ZnuB [Otariodibacter oris]QGM80928.1 zinc ABC transporter permease [Otariodibacter oris]RKR76895.1 zinc transport system permease protein [Otariodibacter oris]
MLEIILPAWIAGVLLSFVTAPLGAFVVWRKMAYFGDTLSHSALLGVALGIFLNIDPYLSVIIMTILLALGLVWLEHYSNHSVDTILGIIAHTSLSLGVITISLLNNVRVDLMSYLFGDLLAINMHDIIFIGTGVIVIVSVLAFSWKKLLSMTISPELAQVEGINIAKLRLLLMVLTAITIALSMKFVGALIITSLLIIPSATARRFARTPEVMVLYSVLFSIISVSGGLLLSSIKDTPAGPSVVICAGFLFMLSLCKKQPN